MPLEAEHVERSAPLIRPSRCCTSRSCFRRNASRPTTPAIPTSRRTPEQEERYWSMLNRAQVLYGFPNESPAGLARVAESNPHLQWIHAMAAGAGGAVKASGLDSETSAKVQGHHLRRRARPSTGRVRGPGHPQRLQAQRRTGTGPGWPGSGLSCGPPPAGERFQAGHHRARRDRP